MGQETDLLAMLATKAESVQTIVRRVGDTGEAFQYAIDITKSQGGKSIAAPGLGDDNRSALQELCSQNEVTLLTEKLRPHIGKMHTGLTMADWGIAETATLVIDSTAEDMRLASMLSETHVAILPASRIRLNSAALEVELNELNLAPPRYLAFISGASRTADIERVLTIGVHGPQELHLLILEDGQT